MLSIVSIVIGLFVLLALYAYYKVKKASREIDRLFKDNEQLTAQNKQLQTEKTVAEIQVKHHQVRQKNEENISSSSRERIIDRLHTNNDLRD